MFMSVRSAGSHAEPFLKFQLLEQFCIGGGKFGSPNVVETVQLILPSLSPKAPSRSCLESYLFTPFFFLALDCRIAARVSTKEMVVVEMERCEHRLFCFASPLGALASARCTCAKCCAYTSALLSVQYTWPCPDPFKRRAFSKNGFLRLVIGSSLQFQAVGRATLSYWLGLLFGFVLSLSPCSRSLP